MPGDRCATARLLDEQRLVERHEIIAVHSGGNREQLRVAIDPQGGLGELQRPQDQVHHLLRRIFRGFRLEHLHRVPPIGQAGAAERIAERLGPEQCRRLLADAQGRAALRIQFRAAFGGQAGQDVLQVVLDIDEFLGAKNILEDIEAAAPIGIQNVRMHLAVRGKVDRPPVAQAEGALLALRQIGLHRGRFRAVIACRAG